MLDKAFIMVNIDVGTEAKVAAQLKKINGATEVCFLYGNYDFIVRVEANSLEAVKNCVTNIRRLENVKSTLTMTVVA